MKLTGDIQELFDEVGVRIDDKGIFLPKDLCLVSLLNFYTEHLGLEKYDAVADFLYELELAFKICDGNKSK